MFTIDGKTEIMKWMAGESATAPTHIATGEGTTSTTEDDSALESELQRDALETTTRSGREVLFEVVIPSTDLIGESLSEIGLLNAASAGTLFIRDVFSTIPKTKNFEVQVDIITRLL